MGMSSKYPVWKLFENKGHQYLSFIYDQIENVYFHPKLNIPDTVKRNLKWGSVICLRGQIDLCIICKRTKRDIVFPKNGPQRKDIKWKMEGSGWRILAQLDRETPVWDVEPESILRPYLQCPRTDLNVTAEYYDPPYQRQRSGLGIPGQQNYKNRTIKSRSFKTFQKSFSGPWRDLTWSSYVSWYMKKAYYLN